MANYVLCNFFKQYLFEYIFKHTNNVNIFDVGILAEILVKISLPPVCLVCQVLLFPLPLLVTELASEQLFELLAGTLSDDKPPFPYLHHSVIS